MKKVFLQNHDKLLQLLSLRLSGWTFTSLAEFYHCDRSSLRYQCRKYQVFPVKTVYVRNSKEVFNVERILNTVIAEIRPEPAEIRPEPVVSKWIEIDGERINMGRSYSEYLNSPYNQLQF